MGVKTDMYYGCGLATWDLDKASPDRVRALIAYLPDYESEMKEKASKDGLDYEALSTEELTELKDTLEDAQFACGMGVADIIAEVVCRLEGITLTTCSDYEGNRFLLFVPSYPWQMTEREMRLSPEELEGVFEKYVKALSDKTLSELDYGDKEVENIG